LGRLSPKRRWTRAQSLEIAKLDSFVVLNQLSNPSLEIPFVIFVLVGSTPTASWSVVASRGHSLPTVPAEAHMPRAEPWGVTSIAEKKSLISRVGMWALAGARRSKSADFKLMLIGAGRDPVRHDG